MRNKNIVTIFLLIFMAFIPLTNLKADSKENKNTDKKLIVIDPGHQGKANLEKEPIGPNAKTKKAKVAAGTYGKHSKLYEYELTLIVSLKLKDELEKQGYRVIMIRETHDIDISNSERAKIANENKADAFLRIHANGSDKDSTNGIMTICQTKNNPYNGNLYEKSKSLSENILNEMVKSTGAKKLYVWETDTMSGVNWCEVPVSIIEMGFMTNKKEDLDMASDEYQDKLIEGIINGLELYFEKL